MQNNNDQLDSLEYKLKTLSSHQQYINTELNRIREEIEALKENRNTESADKDHKKPVAQQIVQAFPPPNPSQQAAPIEKKIFPQNFVSQKKMSSKQLEDVIGTNIINKIGILITVVGVFIGVKYAIDKDLISPAMRVVLGYALAVGLLAIAQKLKAKYHDFSSVIMSGGVTIIYFITFIAYSFYNLFPQTVAFLLMVATTVLVVRMALIYDRKIIALLGQVGAYAVPFLLSDGSGKVLVLFSYISIINIGLLILSVKKDWKIIYQSAFIVSWIIYLATLTPSISTVQSFTLPFIFLVINFITFYAAFLSYKMVKKELYQLREIIILLINAFAFFLIGYNFIHDSFTGTLPLTIFTLANACLHITAGILIKKRNLTDATVAMFILGLGIAFITIVIPVTFADSWISLLWVIETSILYYIGYRSGRHLYLMGSLALFILTMFSLLIDWRNHFGAGSFANTSVSGTPAFYNIIFANSLIVCACLGWMSRVAINNKEKITGWINTFFTDIIPLFFIGLLYLTICLEIDLWWSIDIANHRSVQAENFAILSEIMYSQLYISAWLLVNHLYIKNKNLAAIMGAATLISTLMLLTAGLNAIGDIRQAYLHSHTSVTIWMLGVRYICFAFLALQMILLRKNQVAYFNTPDTSRVYTTLLNLVLLTFICNEFIHWMDINGYTNQYKLGLSIICGLYALALIVFGIMKKKKHLRISAIVLLGATLVKLFFYDLVSLSTISKTIVLIILGVILLIASFLYNKFKNSIFGDE